MRNFLLSLLFFSISIPGSAAKTYTYDLKKVDCMHVVYVVQDVAAHIVLTNYTMDKVSEILKHGYRHLSLTLKQHGKPDTIIYNHRFFKGDLSKAINILKEAEKNNQLVSLKLEGLEADEVTKILEYGVSIYALDIEVNTTYDPYNAAPIIAKAKNLKSLKILNLGAINLTDADVKELASAEVLKTLEVLDLAGNKITADGAMAIAASPNLRNLKVLQLGCFSSHENKIEDDGIQAIAESPYLTKLEALNVSKNNIGSKGIKAILNSKHFSHLRKLDLSENLLKAEDIALLGQSNILENLQELNIGQVAPYGDFLLFMNKSSHFGPDAFSKWSTLIHLETLAYWLNDDEAQVIANLPCLKNLTSMEGSLSAKGLKAIVDSPYIQNLVRLNVKGPCGDEGAKIIAESKNFQHLKGLNLANSNITDEGFMALTKSKNFSQLEDWLIYDNPITNKGVIFLAEHGHFPKLKLLNLMSRGGFDYPTALALSKSKAFPARTRVCINFKDEDMPKIRKLGKDFNQHFHYCAGP